MSVLFQLDIPGFLSYHKKHHFLILCLLWVSLVSSVEPPFPPDALQEIHRLSSLSSLIDTTKLLQSVDPAAIQVYANSGAETSNSQPNPIAKSFPESATGTINATLTVLPIDYALARAIIPSKYAILKDSIYSALPGFPPNKYPLMLSTQIDHDVQSGGIRIPDFSIASFRFPFVDLLSDGYSAFSYVPTAFVSNDPIAIAGATGYGQESIIAKFDPPHDPYAFVPAGFAIRDGEYYFNVYRNNIPVLNTTFAPQPGQAGHEGVYPLSFYANVTNQPTFGCHDPLCLLTCDNMIRFFRTRITIGDFSPVGVTGCVFLAKSSLSAVNFFPNGMRWEGVHGVKLDTAFLENNYRRCSDLKGYTYMDV